MGKTKSTKYYRKQTRTRQAKGQMDENDVLIHMSEDIKKCWMNVSDISNIQDKWRRVEDSTITTAIRICMKLKGKQCYLTKLEQDDAFKFGLVYDEFSRLLYTIRLAYGEVESEIFSDEELSQRFYEKDIPALLELWGSCSLISADLMVALLIDNWNSTDDHDDLAKSLTVCSTSCVKQVVLSCDLVQHPIPDNIKDSTKSTVFTVIEHLTSACDSLVKIVKCASCMEEDHSAEDAILNMITWSLYGLNYISVNVLKPILVGNSEDVEDDLKKYSKSLESLFPLLRQLLKQHKLEPSDDIDSKQEEDSQNKEENDNKNKQTSKSKDKNKAKEDQSVEKTDEEKVEPSQPSIEDLLKTLEKEYEIFTKEFLGSGKVSICQEDPNGSDVSLFYRPEQYREIADCTVGSCDMKDRNDWIKDLPLTEDQTLVSDIYIVRNGPLKTSTDVEIDFIVLPVANSAERQIQVKVNNGGSWNDMDNVQQEVSEAKTHLSFKVSSMDAFIAYIDNPSESHEILPQGSTYTNADNEEIQVKFLPDIVDSPVKAHIKVVQHDSKEVTSYREKCLDSIMGIICLSDAVEIRTDEEVEVKKNMVVTVRMEDNPNTEKDSQLVVIRYNDTQVQVLDKSQCRITKDGTNFKVECKGLWSIAVARVKKIFLNMRDSLKKEFLVMSGKVQMCNLMTYIDDSSRDMSKGGAMFWLDFVEKNMLKEDIEMKLQMGFIEVKNSRSKDLAVKQNQTFDLAIEGQIKLTLSNGNGQNFKMTYLKGADNHVTIPIEVKRDQEKEPFATFKLSEDGSDTPIHVVAIPVRDLSELSSDDIASRPMIKLNENNNARDELKLKEEAAKCVLAHNSLMELSRELSERDVRKLSHQLGVSEDLIDKFKDQMDGDIVRTNFQTLCEWRGKTGRATMVDFLISSLRTCGRSDCANIIGQVRSRQRGLTREDFHR
ncbi:uncharacterized protein [Mytilus edulis]|uniref:uncharacterized protein isoform X1 n=2 Tax=Mytilus edulis TaxID=6550 RepID=UPI0039EE2BEB